MPYSAGTSTVTAALPSLALPAIGVPRTVEAAASSSSTFGAT